MNLERELYDFLESVQGHLPSQMHKTYEQAVDRAMRRNSRRGNNWWRREQRQEEISVSIFALVIGLIGGAALMYLFDPERGARRRALLQIRVEDALNEAGSSIGETTQRVREDVEKAVGEVEKAVGGAVESVKETTEQVRGDFEKTVSNVTDSAKDTAAQVDKAVDNTADSANNTANQVGQAMSGAAKDAANKVASTVGAAQQQPVASAATSDQTLTVRVRSVVAGNVRAPGAITVDVKDGTVTLTGTILAGEVQGLVEKIQAIPGVSKVDNRLEIHDAAQT